MKKQFFLMTAKDYQTLFNVGVRSAAVMIAEDRRKIKRKRITIAQFCKINGFDVLDVVRCLEL